MGLLCVVCVLRVVVDVVVRDVVVVVMFVFVAVDVVVVFD